MPQIIDKSPAAQVNAGESVELFVKVSGTPTPTGILIQFIKYLQLIISMKKRIIIHSSDSENTKYFSYDVL